MGLWLYDGNKRGLIEIYDDDDDDALQRCKRDEDEKGGCRRARRMPVVVWCLFGQQFQSNSEIRPVYFVFCDNSNHSKIYVGNSTYST